MSARWRLGKHDVSASLVVLLVALPLCMGVAIASGMPPSAGLITGIVGGLLVGGLTGSPLQVSGPAAGLTVLVWNVVENHGLAAVGGIVLLAGIFQAVAALLGLGRLFRAISPAVVYGMLGGIGVLIVASQWHVMFDHKPAKSGLENLLGMPAALRHALNGEPRGHLAAAALGTLTIAGIVAWNRWKPRRLALLPAPLIGVLLASVTAAAAQLEVHHVSVPDNILGAVQLPTAAGLRALFGPQQLIAAFSLAIIASAETLLCAGAVDRMQDKVRTDYDRELLAQGVGNAVCGALGALPMTGVIVRSSANVGAGAETRASTILHGLWMLGVVVLLPGLLRAIPTASLAGVLVHTGFKLVSPAHLRELRAFGWQPVGIYAVTLISIVASDLLTGVLLGVTLSLIRLLLHLGNFTFEVRQTGARVDASLAGAVTFVGLPRLAAQLEALPHAAELHLRVDEVAYVDHACLVAIADFERLRKRAGERVYIPWSELDGRSEKVRGDAEGLLASGSGH